MISSRDVIFPDSYRMFSAESMAAIPALETLVQQVSLQEAAA